jgi:hypothetical protein
MTTRRHQSVAVTLDNLTAVKTYRMKVVLVNLLANMW